METLFKFSCIYCGQHIECETTLSGRQIKCPACDKRIVIPAPERGKPVRKEPLTKFTWDTVVQTPEVQDRKPRGGATP
jgi:DNA-directed RNA polymerase subunit RPC12/RpoP